MRLWKSTVSTLNLKKHIPNVSASLSTTIETNIKIPPHLCKYDYLDQKLSFSVKEDKNNHTDKQEYHKMIQLHFVDLAQEQELEQSFFELKSQLLESKVYHNTDPKTKLIFYTEEQQLTSLLHKAKFLGIDLSHVPSALYSPDLHEDLAQHLGTFRLRKDGNSLF